MSVGWAVVGLDWEVDDWGGEVLAVVDGVGGEV